MNRIFLVATREFASVVFTRGFLLGFLLTPVIIAVAIGAVALVSRLDGPKISGRVAVIDNTPGAVVGPRVTDRFSPASENKAAEAQMKEVEKAAKEQLDRLNLPKDQTDAGLSQMRTQAKQLAKPADLSVELLDGSATDTESLKNQIRDAKITTKNEAGDGEKPYLALAVVPPGSLTPGADGGYADFELFVNPRLDFEIKQRIRDRVGSAVVDARLATDPRVAASGLSADAVRALVRAPRPEVRELTATGDRASTGPLQMLVPVAFMVLLMISVMSGGQYLLTAVVEEKGSRVMEVLLSAVSPMQLMVGKILGQMAVALTILVVYGGLGIAGLITFALADLVKPITLVWFVIFFFIAFFTIASLMAAVGAAVNEMREAQTLLAPVMMIVMLPWLLWMPISRAPNSTFATVMSFIPGVNPFVMAIRLGGSEPIPMWQIPVAILVGLVGAAFCAWAAAKIFRIGVLMYGKPPDLKTMIRWVRMA